MVISKCSATMVDSLQWFLPSCDWSNLKFLSLAWRLRMDPIVGSNAPNPNPIYASIRLAFHPKCALSAHKCIAQYRLTFQLSTVNCFPGSTPDMIFLLTANDEMRYVISYDFLTIRRGGLRRWWVEKGAFAWCGYELFINYWHSWILILY